MNILMVSDVYFPRINGVSTSILTFRRELERLDHRTVLIAPDYGGESNGEEGIIRIPSRYVVLDPEDRMMKVREILRHTERLRQGRFDIVHVHTPFIAHYIGVSLSERLGIPCVATYHTFFEEYLFHYVPFLPKSLMRFAARQFSQHQCNQVNGLIVPSRAMHEVLQRYGVTTRTEVIPTGISLERFTGGNGHRFRHAHGIDPGRPTLVYIGRVAFEKNIETLLRVLARVREKQPEVILVIAGEGPAEHSLRKAAHALGLADNLLFVGYLTGLKAVMDCYCAGDAFVFASRTETQGLVLLEAMALGVPVVSTAVMGTRDILDAEQGALVAEEDVEDFAGKVLQVLQNPELRTRLSVEGREYVREWSAKRMAQKLLDFYRETVADAHERLTHPAH